MNILDITDKYAKIPQDYSFFVFGTHGAGLQSMLFFISRLKHNDRSVLPLPLHWTNQSIVPNLTNLLWKKRIEGNLPKNSWGLTFEGSPKNLKWINKNIKKQIPAILLVRDPIDALISHINYYVGKDIFVDDRFLNIDYYCQNILNTNIQLDRTCGFWKNQEALEKNITKKMYVDTQEIIGKKTKSTMGKIADFLGFCCPDWYDFDVRVNSQFERPFPFTTEIKGCKYYLSCFPNKYKNELFPTYQDEKIYYIDEFYLSSHFPNKRFYIFSESEVSYQDNKEIKEWAESILHLHSMKMKKYEENKITVNDLLDFLDRHNEVCQKLRDYINGQIEIITKEKPSLISSWSNFSYFMNTL